MTDKFVEVSNIETNMCFIKLAEAMIFVNDVKGRIKAFGKIFDREIEKKFRHLLFLMQDAVDYHEKHFDRMVWDAAPEVNRNDRFRQDASEFAQLSMLYAEKCGDCEANKKRIFDFIKSLPDGMNVIDDEDVERLKLR